MTFLDAAYGLACMLASPWLLWRRWRRGRWPAAILARFRGDSPARPSGPGPVVWLHGVSVGEINLLQCLIERLQAARPDVQCVVSTSTPTGYELARRKYADLPVFYCPLDFSWAVRRVLKRLQPQLLVLGELELWPQLIRLASRHGVRVAVANGRLSQNSHRGYRRLRPWMRRLLAHIDWLGVQDATYARRFGEIGASERSLEVTGSLKFDGVVLDPDNPLTAALREQAAPPIHSVLWLAGSTQEDDERAVLKAYGELSPRNPDLRLILVPRHQERFNSAARLIENAGFEVRLRSELDHVLSSEQWDSRSVLLVDSIGELGAWWGMANIAYVGGGMGARGGQNMIEPAAYGAAVCFGPNTRNFREVTEMLLRDEAAAVVHDAEELEAFVQRCLSDPAWARQRGRRARDLVLRNQGAADLTVQRLLQLLPDASRQQQRKAA